MNQQFLCMEHCVFSETETGVIDFLLIFPEIYFLAQLKMQLNESKISHHAYLGVAISRAFLLKSAFQKQVYSDKVLR